MQVSTNTITAPPAIRTPVFWLLFSLIALFGITLRHWEVAAWRKTGFDELLYRRYVNLMDGGTQRVGVFQKDQSLAEWEFDVKGTGAGSMPSLTSLFLRTQSKPGTECELPPTRFLYIYTSWLWKNVRFGETAPLPMREISGEWRMSVAAWDDQPRAHDADHRDPALRALHDVSRWATILTMIAAGLFASRMFGHGIGLAIMALMAVDPVQLHLSQHAMIDAFFTLMATLSVWTTWECLRAPSSRGWLLAHAVTLALMVLTKENAFFVFCALTAVVIANPWLKFGTVTRRFLLVSIAGAGAGFVILVLLAGGPGPFKDVYKTLVSKAQDLPYAQLTGDGPWYRYLLDIMSVSPLVLVLAIGALFVLVPRRSDLAFLALFMAASYLIMCNVKFGMNLRYASIWELPLRAGAVLMTWQLCARFGGLQWRVATLAVAAVCLHELRQYLILEQYRSEPIEIAHRPVQDPALYELVPSDILQKINVIKRYGD